MINTAVVHIYDPARDMNRLHREIVGAEATAKEKAAELGEMLEQQKNALKHGEFMSWIRENCEFSQDMANKYIKVSKAKIRTRSEFDRCTSIREVLELGKAPKATKATVTEATVTKVKALYAKANDAGSTEAEKEEAEAQITKIAAKHDLSTKQLLKKAKVEEAEPVKGGHEAVFEKAIAKLAQNPKKWLIELLIKAAFGNAEAQQQVQSEIMKGL